MNPHEIILWKIIPAIKRDMALILINKGISQKKTAQYLDLTPSAISQYIHGKRAAIKLPDDSLRIIENSVNAILDGKTTVKKEIVKILREKPIASLLCEIHKKEEPEFEDCNIKC